MARNKKLFNKNSKWQNGYIDSTHSMKAAGGRLQNSQKGLTSARKDATTARKFSRGGAHSPSQSQIRRVNPSSHSMESHARTRARRRRGGGGVASMAWSRALLNILLVVGLVVAAVAVALAAGHFAYGNSIGKNMHKNLDESVAQVLAVPADETESTYTLIVGTDDGAEATDGVASLILVYTSPSSKLMTYVSIPPNSRVVSQSNGRMALGSVYAIEGPASLVAVLSELCGIEIAHYVEYDFDELDDIVDYFGGFQVEIENSFKDFEYNVTMDAGLQYLSGELAVYYCRATQPFAEGLYATADHQREICIDVVDALLATDNKAFRKGMEALSHHLTSDFDFDTLKSWHEAMQGRNYVQSVYSMLAPGDEVTVNDVTYTTLDTTRLVEMFERVGSDLPPDATEAQVLLEGGDPVAASTVDPTLYSIDLRNGSGVEGCASEAEEILTAAGYNVVSVGNADAFLYDETLVVYTNAEFEKAAKAVVHELGCGRTISNTGNYSFTTRLLVVIGNDWTPRH